MNTAKGLHGLLDPIEASPYWHAQNTVVDGTDGHEVTVYIEAIYWDPDEPDGIPDSFQCRLDALATAIQSNQWWTIQHFDVTIETYEPPLVELEIVHGE